MENKNLNGFAMITLSKDFICLLYHKHRYYEAKIKSPSSLNYVMICKATCPSGQMSSPPCPPAPASPRPRAGTVGDLPTECGPSTRTLASRQS